MTDLSGGRARRARSHDAAASAIGYMYQVELGLVELLSRATDNPSIAVRFELLDDVSFEADGTPEELLQAKHHLNTAASLGDSSVDLWRTIAVWADAVREGLNPADIRFSLVTTAAAASGSIASLLGANGRAVTKAVERLERVAQTSTSVANRERYKGFLSMPEQARHALVGSMTILDRARSITDLPRALHLLIRRAANRQAVPALADRLLGWWYGRVIRHLQSGAREPISAEEVERQIDDLREQFAGENLPVDVLDDDPGLAALGADDRMFVHQLQLIAVSDSLIELAIRDYKRAFLQRSRWVLDGLIFGDELYRYERRLVDEWRHHVAFAEQRRPADASEAQSQEEGFAVYETMQNSPTWLRDVREPFVVRGSLHALADDFRIGWHPDFVARLRHLLKEFA